MNNTCGYQNLSKEIEGLKVYFNYPLKTLNKYGTGGNASASVFPTNSDELQFVVNAIKGKYPYYVIGGGSNLLISDKGFDGVIISTQKINRIDIKSNLITAECGAKLKDVISEMKMNCFSGLEFAVGIPATVGGAVSMNAGCFGKSISEVVKYVITENGVYTNQECEFSIERADF